MIDARSLLHAPARLQVALCRRYRRMSGGPVPTMRLITRRGLANAVPRFGGEGTFALAARREGRITPRQRPRHDGRRLEKKYDQGETGHGARALPQEGGSA